MKVAAVQHDILWEATATNLDRLTPRVEQAAALGARLVVLSEMFATGFSMATERMAESFDGKRIAVTSISASPKPPFFANSSA